MLASRRSTRRKIRSNFEKLSYSKNKTTIVISSN